MRPAQAPSLPKVDVSGATAAQADVRERASGAQPAGLSERCVLPRAVHRQRPTPRAPLLHHRSVSDLIYRVRSRPSVLVTSPEYHADEDISLRATGARR